MYIHSWFAAPPSPIPLFSSWQVGVLNQLARTAKYETNKSSLPLRDGKTWKTSSGFGAGFFIIPRHQYTSVMFLVSTPRPCACWYFGAGVGWGNNVLFHFNHVIRSLALPHIRHATLAPKRDRQCPQQTRTSLCLKQKKELFHEALGTQNYSFVVVKHYMIYIYNYIIYIYMTYRFSKFEATVPWNFNRNFTEEK